MSQAGMASVEINIPYGTEFLTYFRDSHAGPIARL
jgi:hypothetical protein